MHKFLLLIPVLFLACRQQPGKAAAGANGTEVPFTLIHGNVNGDSAVFERAGITASFTTSGGMQVIHITRQGKRLINYIRAMDSTTTIIPAPGLIINGADTSIHVKAGTRHYFFLIKDNKATKQKAKSH